MTHPPSPLRPFRLSVFSPTSKIPSPAGRLIAPSSLRSSKPRPWIDRALETSLPTQENVDRSNIYIIPRRAGVARVGRSQITATELARVRNKHSSSFGRKRQTLFELFDQQLADSSQAFASLSRSGVSHGSALAAKSVRSGAKTGKKSAKWRESTRFGAKRGGKTASGEQKGQSGAEKGLNGAVEREKITDQVGDDT